MFLRSTLTLLVTLAACKTYDPLYCDENTPCTDPDRPFCDIAGEYPASDGIGRTCIPDPRCESGAFIECDGDTLVTCGEDGLSEAEETCDVSCNADEEACNECEPGTSTCSDAVERACGDDGKPVPDRSCNLGCDETNSRCADIEPSNNLEAQLERSEEGPDLVLPEGTTIDTVVGTVFVDGRSVDVPTELLPAPEGGVPVRVFIVNSLRVSGTVVVSGAPAIAFVSNEDIVLEGLVRVDANGHTEGPGAGPDGHGVGFATGFEDTRRGGGGGGFGKVGGQGGDGADIGPIPGNDGGAVVGTEELVPLRGGGSGGDPYGTGGQLFEGDGQGGGGGGAIQLVSRTIIAITDGGAIDAGGAAGPTSYEGGGAGGGLLLEAPTVVVSGSTTALAANGGGGGCAGTISQEAEDGRLDATRAAGCIGSQSTGGEGGAGNLVAKRGVDGGAGGGGAVGRIRINNVAGTFGPMDGAIVSPPATVGSLAIH